MPHVNGLFYKSEIYLSILFIKIFLDKKSFISLKNQYTDSN